MKKIFLSIVIIIIGGALFLSVPFTTVSAFTVTVVNQNNQRISTDAIATYFDKDSKPIIEITLKTPGSWANNLHWWSHSSHPQSQKHPSDAKQATSVKIDAKGCTAVIIPVILEKIYEPLSLSLHGGGAAYYYYRFEQAVTLHCQ